MLSMQKLRPLLPLILTAVLAASAAILGVTLFTASNAVKTDAVIANALFAIENEVDGAYTAAALENEFALGKQLCTSFCVAGAIEQNETLKAQINGIVGATCTCYAGCLCSGYEQNFKTYLAGGTSELAAMSGLSSALSKLPWSKVYDIKIGVTGITMKVSTKLGDAPDLNPRLTDTSILGTEAGAYAPAYGGFAVILSSQWETLKATFEPALEEYDMASLTPGDAVVHQKFTGENEFESEEYKALMDEEFAAKVAFAGTAPLSATGANPDYPSNELDYKKDWYARLAYGKENCPLKSQEYEKREYAIVNGSAVVTDYDPSERMYGGVSEHESNYSHCDACESAPPLIRTMKLLGIISAALLCVMSLARLKLGGNALRFASLVFGLIGVAFFALCAYAMIPCASAIMKQSVNYKDYNEGLGLLVSDSLKSTATTKYGSPFFIVLACAIIMLVASVMGGIVKYTPATAVAPAAASKDNVV